MKDERKRASINVSDKTLAKLDAFRKNHENEYPWRQSLVDRIFEDWLNQQSSKSHDSILESAQRISKGEPTTQTEALYKQYVIDSGEPLVTEAQAKQIAALKEKVRIKSEAEEKHQKDIRETERIETEELAKRKNLRSQSYQKPSVNYDTSQGCPPLD